MSTPYRGDSGIAIVLWWCQETLTRWHLPAAVWKAHKADLDWGNGHFQGEYEKSNSPEVEEALARIFALGFGDPEDPDMEKAPWARHVTQVTEINEFVSRFYLMGMDPA